MESTPRAGQWPVDPQEDQPVSKERVWVDGCFDFTHHGHAGAMLQARRLGKELYVGVHSDEAILANKGPTVMTLAERVTAVEACRWTTRCIPHAPYVTSLPWISHYGCYYVVHGDDITSDADGSDCYRFVKQAGRFLVVKRTPGISTTDLVGRMLLCTKGHFIRDVGKLLKGEQGGADTQSSSPEERAAKAEEMMTRIKDYASDETGLAPGCDVWNWVPAPRRRSTNERRESSSGGDLSSDASSSSRRVRNPRRRSSAFRDREERGRVERLVTGKHPKPDQRIVYVDGAFDLFSSGHVEFLRCVAMAEEDEAAARGWYDGAAKAQRQTQYGYDYGPAFVVAGVHDDESTNYWKGVNYPIMNLLERGLCVLQCKYINALVLSTPITPSSHFLSALPYGTPAAIYHGPTSFIPLTHDPYSFAKSIGIFRQIEAHSFAHVNASEIVGRITKSRAAFEERQRVKGVKGIGEAEVKRREEMEREAERVRQRRDVEKQFGL